MTANPSPVIEESKLMGSEFGGYAVSSSSVATGTLLCRFPLQQWPLARF